MKKVFQAAAMLTGMAAIMPLGLMAQAPAQESAPAAPQPSAEEVAELQRIAGAQIASVADVDKRVKDIDAFVLKYPNSQFKGFAFSMAAEASQMKGDRKNAVFYYEKALAADPKDHVAMLMIAAETAQATGEFDLNKEEKLGRSEKLLTTAMELIPAAPKPNAQIPDDQWEAIKKDDMARAYEAQGLIAMVRKQYGDAAAAFRKSIAAAASKMPATYVRLGGALNEDKKYDDAAKVLDEVIAMPDVNPQIKQVAESERQRTQQLRNAK